MPDETLNTRDAANAVYARKLLGYARSQYKGNETEAREVLQTVVIKLAKRFEVFEEERRFWGWLCRVARNAFVDSCRARRHEHRSRAFAT